MAEGAVGVRVLGPVSVDGDLSGDAIGPRLRRVLARLVVGDGVVAEGDLFDAVWSDRGELPLNPTRSLQTYISRLRNHLGSHAVDRLGPGYRLVPDSVWVDVREFEHALAQAGEARRRADDRTAISMLELALGLWSGPALAEFAGEPWAAGEAHRLDELRLDAREQRADLLIGLGDVDGGLVAELEGLAVDNPHREEITRLLMLALYRSGRQADALAAFSRHRRQLATDLGLDPSGALRDLEQQILTDDVVAGPSGTRSLRGYEIMERLGEGAFSIVYRGMQPSVGRQVAIKQIRAELANRPEFVRRFETEAHLVARLEHPHIVPLFDFWREPGSAYLVMRLLRGGSLEGSLRAGPWTLDRVALMVAQIGGALSVAHRAGVVHRDVKPANILLDDDDNAYLTDFGIALESAEAADPDAALSAGSPAYASPEQLRREPVGPAADVHGLAIATFEALTGRLPFPDEPTEAALLQRQLHDPIPSLGETRPDLPSAVDAVLAQATAKRPSARYQSVDEFVSAFEAAVRPIGVEPARIGVGTAVSGGGRNPYKGLRAFDEADVADFAGRARLVDQLIAAVEKSRLVAVVGPSGSGKSSAVRAGLLPALRAGAVVESDTWFTTTLLPGANPFEELETALLRVATHRLSDLSKILTDGPRGISRGIRHIFPEDGAQLLLVIDQFEELFTMADPAETKHFLDALAIAVTDSGSRLRVVLTLRADFYDRPLAHDALGRLVKDATIAVLPLAADELEHAIVDPAHAVGAEFEPGLVSEIVADVADQPGALPLLQYALTELYERRVSGLLMRDAYRELGGVAGALTQRAESLYAESSEEEQDAIRRAFGRLISLGEGSEHTRRRALRTELGESPTTAEIVERYGQARLLSFDRDPVSREPTVEVTHEALLREWPRLRQWLDEDRDGLRILRHLNSAATEWDASDRPATELYRGGRLEAAEDWAKESGADLRPVERAFLDSSLAQRRAEAEAERRQVRRLRSLLALVAVIAVVAVAAGAFAIVEQGRADDERARAEQNAQLAQDNEAQAVVQADNARREAELGLARALAAEAASVREQNPALALVLAAESAAASDPPIEQARRALTGARAAFADRSTQPIGPALSGHAGAVMDVAFNNDDSLLASASRDGTVLLWDPELGEPIGAPLTGHDGPVRAVAFRPGGTMLATAGNDSTVRLWDPATQDQIGPDLDDHAAPVHGVAFNHDGAVLASGDDEGTILLWDPNTGRAVGPLFEGHAAEIRSVAFNHDSTLLASADEGGTILLWDPNTGRATAPPLTGHDGAVRAVAFNHDGTILASAGDDRTVRLWDPATGTAVGEPVTGHTSPVRSVAFNHDGTILASASGEEEQPRVSQTIRLWDPATGAAIGRPLTGHTSTVRTVAFSSEGSTLASGSDDGTVRLWDPTPGEPLGRALTADDAAVRAVAFSPDGSILASAGSDNAVHLRDPATGREIVEPMLGHEGAVRAIAFNHDGTILASTGADATVRLWDPATGQPLGSPLSEHTDEVWGLAFSHDGTVLASAGSDNVVRLWDPSSGLPIGRPLEGHENRLRVLAFNHDGTVLASGSQDNTIRLWDPSTGQPIGEPLVGHTSPIRGLAFSHDGTLLASGGVDGTIRLWDPPTGQPIGEPLRGHGGAVLWVAFTPDDTVLASSSADTTLQLWNPANGQPVSESLLGHGGPVLGVAFNHDGTLLASASVDTTLRVWDRLLDVELACELAGPYVRRAQVEAFLPSDRPPRACAFSR